MIYPVPEIKYSDHALEQMAERGATKSEVKVALLRGERAPAKKGRHAYRLNFQYNKIWGSKHYAIKQVMPIVKEETDKITVITVYTFYF